MTTTAFAPVMICSLGRCVNPLPVPKIPRYVNFDIRLQLCYDASQPSDKKPAQGHPRQFPGEGSC